MKDDKTIKEQLKELEDQIAWFDSENFSLEEAQKKFQTAEALAEDIKNKLSLLKNEITVISKKFDSE